MDYISNQSDPIQVTRVVLSQGSILNHVELLPCCYYCLTTGQHSECAGACTTCCLCEMIGQSMRGGPVCEIDGSDDVSHNGLVEQRRPTVCTSQRRRVSVIAYILLSIHTYRRNSDGTAVMDGCRVDCKLSRQEAATRLRCGEPEPCGWIGSYV